MKPVSTKQDYIKNVLAYDELLKIRIANDNTISKARAESARGETVQLTPQELKTTTELINDLGQQEATARNNLKRLGFSDEEVAQIIVSLMGNPDDILILNQTFPNIEKDVKNKFNIKLVTPSFFLEYLKQYFKLFAASKGMEFTSNNSLINSVEELKQIIPTNTTLIKLFDAVIKKVRFTTEFKEQLNKVANAYPTQADFENIRKMDPVTQQVEIDKLMKNYEHAPDPQSIRDLLEKVVNGQITQSDLITQIENIINTKVTPVQIPTAQVQTLSQQEIDALKKTQNKASTTQALLDNVNSWDDFKNLNLKNTNLFITYTGIKDLLINSFGNKLKKIDRIDQEAYRLDNNSGNFKKVVEAYLSLKGDKEKLTPGTASYEQVKTISGSGLKRKNKIMFGKGIAIKEQVPIYNEFGKFVINRPKLELNDILNVKYKSLGPIPKFKNEIAVSDIFRDFLITLLDTGKLNQKDYMKIAPDERLLFEELSISAGIFSGFGLQRTTTSKDAEENMRFELLRGQIMAGNNNPNIISEFRKLVVKFMSTGKIRKNEGLNLLIEL